MTTMKEDARFSAFKKAVLAYTRPFGIRVQFKAANGRYYGNCPGGLILVGNPANRVITPRYENMSKRSGFRSSDMQPVRF